MDQQQQQQQQRFRTNSDEDDGSRNVDAKIDAESGNVQRTTEEKSKEEVVILSTEKSSNFTKTATISIISDVHVAGDTVNRYAIYYTKKKIIHFFEICNRCRMNIEFGSLWFRFQKVFSLIFQPIEFLKSEFSCVLHSIFYVGIVYDRRY